MSSSKRKVLFLIESLSSGSGTAPKALATLVQYIDKTKYDVTVCAINGGGKYESVVRENANYKAILDAPDGTKHNLVYKGMPLSWVYKFFVPKDSDVEVAFVEGFTTKLLSCSSNKKAKKYAWVHSNLHQNHWTKEVYKSIDEEAKAYSQFNKILCTSELTKLAFTAEFPALRVPMDTIYNPIDSLSVRLKSLNVNSDATDDSVTRLVTVGNLEAPQEYSRLLRIVNRLVKEGYKIHLGIFGDGSEHGILERYIKENDLKESVKLYGAHPNRYKYLAQGKLYICPSFGNVAVEALILGLPIITTDARSMSELLKDGECGMLVDNTEEALYTGLKRLLDDSELLKQYQQKAEARGWDFDIEALMVPIENLLAE